MLSRGETGPSITPRFVDGLRRREVQRPVWLRRSPLTRGCAADVLAYLRSVTAASAAAVPPPPPPPPSLDELRANEEFNFEYVNEEDDEIAAAIRRRSESNSGDGGGDGDDGDGDDDDDDDNNDAATML